MTLLREALLSGAMARTDDVRSEVLYTLKRAGLLIDDKPRHILRLGFPLDVVERWFPKLYPVN